MKILWNFSERSFFLTVFGESMKYQYNYLKNENGWQKVDKNYICMKYQDKYLQNENGWQKMDKNDVSISCVFPNLGYFQKKLYLKCLSEIWIFLICILEKSNEPLCATSYRLYNLKTWTTDMEECYWVFYRKRCSEKFHKIHRKAPALESLF